MDGSTELQSSVDLARRLNAIWSVAHYGLRVMFRYGSNVVMLVAVPLMFGLLGSIFTRLLDPQAFSIAARGNTSLVAFMLSGFAIYVVSNGANGLAGVIEGEASQGTLGANMMSPTPLISIVTGFALANLIFSGATSALLLLGLAASVGVHIGVWIIGRILLAYLVFFGLGLTMSGLAIRFKRVGGIFQTISFVEQFLAGAFIPIGVLPPWLRPVSYLMPTTWVLDYVRSGFLGLEMIASIPVETAIVAGLALLTNVTGVIVLRVCERRTRMLGLVDVY